MHLTIEYYHDNSSLDTLPNGGPRPRAPGAKHEQYRDPLRAPRSKRVRPGMHRAGAKLICSK